MMNLIEHLQQIPDFRRTQGLRYPLTAVLLMTIMSIMSGRCRYREIAAFAKANQKELLTFFHLTKRKRLPSHVSFRTILKGIDFDEVLTAFNAWAKQYITLSEEEWMSLDGNALASTVIDYASSYQNFVSLVSVFSHKRGQVLCAGTLENKKCSEIPTVQEFIATLDLTDVVFSLDALHCQQKTVEAIIESHNDYVIQVKRNQPTLFQSIETAFDSQPPLSSVTHDEQSRGRHEIRTVDILEAPEDAREKWKGLQRIIHVVREGSRDGKTFLAHHDYISSLCSDDAELFAKGIRGHWSIENRLHWVKDVIQHEDDSGIKKGNGVETLSILKNIAMNISRELGFDSIKGATIHFASNVKELCQYFRT